MQAGLLRPPLPRTSLHARELNPTLHRFLSAALSSFPPFRARTPRGRTTPSLTQPQTSGDLRSPPATLEPAPTHWTPDQLSGLTGQSAPSHSSGLCRFSARSDVSVTTARISRHEMHSCSKVSSRQIRTTSAFPSRAKVQPRF